MEHASNLVTNEVKIIELMQDLKEAIQNGQLPPTTPVDSAPNVNNLSNQTFSYIVNWLKQQQQQQQIDSEQSQKLKINGWPPEHSVDCKDSDPEIKILKEQLCLNEREKNRLFNQLKEFQVENLELKTKLINLSSTSLTVQANCYSTNGSSRIKYSNSSQTAQLNGETEKDHEIVRLRRMIDDLVKSNEDKDKKIEELTKQVIRFKRIQEIVLNAQASLANSKVKTLADLDFSTDAENSSMNNYSLINTNLFDESILFQHSMLNNGNYVKINNHKLIQSKQFQPPTQPPPAIPQSNHANDANQQQQQQQMVASTSLSSSISSSSSTNSSSASGTNQQQQQQQQKSSSESSQPQAPLATISELVGYNSSSSTNLTLGQSNATKSQLNVVLTAAHDQSAHKAHPSAHTLVGSINNTSMETVKAKSLSSAKLVDNSHYMTQSLMVNNGNNYDEIGKLVDSANLINSSYKSASVLTSNTVTGGNGTNSSSSTSYGKGLKNFFGKLIRTSLVNINDTQLNQTVAKNVLINENNALLNGSAGGSFFKRGGKRATANARLQNFSFSNNSLLTNGKNTPELRSFIQKQQSLTNAAAAAAAGKSLDTLTFAKWTSDKVYDWLRQNGFDSYFTYNTDGSLNNKWIKNGLHLLQASTNDYEKELGIKNPLHRKRLTLLLQSLYSTATAMNTPDYQFITCVDQHWVIKWLDDIGLPQYKDGFNEAKIDGRMLYHLNSEDIMNLGIMSELHYISIKRAIHVLRLNNFDTQCLRRRPSGDERLDKAEVMLWTNHRIMEWLRSIDLSEYAPNLRGSGVHGGLMLFEPRFSATVLADILSIPSSKTLLRRHLTTLFNDLVGAQMLQAKKDAESQPGYQPLNASAKLKQSKRSIGLFSSHKRTKSQDSKDLLLNGAPQSISQLNNLISQQLTQTINSGTSKSYYSTLPNQPDTNNRSNNDQAYNKSKLSFLNINQDTPTSIV